MYIGPDMSEFMITGRNMMYLREIGLEVNLSDSAAIDGFVQSKLSSNATGSPQRIKIDRSWWMLVLIFLLFATEWILRRRLRLD